MSAALWTPLVMGARGGVTRCGARGKAAAAGEAGRQPGGRGRGVIRLSSPAERRARDRDQALDQYRRRARVRTELSHHKQAALAEVYEYDVCFEDDGDGDEDGPRGLPPQTDSLEHYLKAGVLRLFQWRLNLHNFKVDTEVFR